MNLWGLQRSVTLAQSRELMKPRGYWSAPGLVCPLGGCGDEHIVFSLFTVPIFRITSERLEGESVTEALKFGELQQLELPFLMSGRAKGWNGSGSTAQGSSEVLLSQSPHGGSTCGAALSALKGAPVLPHREHSWGSTKGSTFRPFLGVQQHWELWEPCLYHEKIDLGMSCPYIRVYIMTSKISSLQKISCLRGQLLALLKTFQSLNSSLGCASPLQGPVPQVVTQSMQLLISSGALSASDQMLRSSQVARLIKSFSMTEWLTLLESVAHRY